MPKPVCVPCQRFFKPTKNGVAWTEMKPIEAQAPSGTAKPEAWTPYKIWRGDEWTCQGCGAVIIVGNGWRPIAESYEPKFAGELAATGAYKVKVNDC